MTTWGRPKVAYGWRLLLLLAVGVPGAVALAPAGARAGGQPQAYVALASAAGARVSWVVPGQFAVEEVVDGGGPVAQSRLDAGSGESFASLPYPGGNAVAYQGLLSVATGISSPFAYPFFVSATNPGAPEADMADPSGAYRLHADAKGTSTGAVARFRPGSAEAATSGGQATTSISADGAQVTSTAESVSDAISLAGGALRVASVRSRSVTTFTSGADKPETATSLQVDGLAAGDTRFGVGPDGFVVLGQPVASPARDAQALLDQILAPAGLSLRFVQAQALTGGGQAAALEIVSNQPQPEFPSSRISLRLGGASSAVSLGEGPLPGPPADLPGAIPPPAASNPAGSPEPSGEPAPATPAPATAPAPLPLSDAFGSGTPVAASAPGLPALPALTGPDGTATGHEAVSTAATAPAGAPAPGTRELVAQPIVRPRKVGATRVVYGLVGAGAALMLLLGGAITKRGGAAAWLDAA